MENFRKYYFENKEIIKKRIRDYTQRRFVVFRFAIVSADKSNGIQFRMHGERDDCTGFLNWINIWNGVHFSYDEMSKDSSILLNFDCVMLSGNPRYLVDLISITTFLKHKVVTMFLPEGDISLYDMQGINSFNKEIYECYKSCDIICSMEEDKISYYELFTNSLIKFIHVPIDENMEKGLFRNAISDKEQFTVVYGDNNPNCPVTVFAVLAKINKASISVCIHPDICHEITRLFGTQINTNYSKVGQYPYLRMLAKSWLHIYPTRWIGSAREQIACAVAGTPCIGSDKSHTQKRLFPKLACDIYDAKTMIDLANKLYIDMDFYNEVRDYSWKALSFYSMENTKKRFMDAYSEIRKRWNND